MTNSPYVRTNHIICVQRVDGYLGAGNGEMEHLLHATAHDTKADLRAALAAQTAHDVRTLHLNTGYGGVVDGDDAVAGEDAHLLGRTLRYGLDDEKRIAHHIKLDADTVKRSLQWFVESLRLLGCGV